MGLDQYAFAVNQGESLTDSRDATELAYWRKHNRLQGWMHECYNRKGGDGAFNGGDVLELTLEDLEELEQAVRERKLPRTEGFFFGVDSYEGLVPLVQLAASNASDTEIAKIDPLFGDDIKFIEAAREALLDGKKVIYECSW